MKTKMGKSHGKSSYQMASVLSRCF